MSRVARVDYVCPACEELIEAKPSLEGTSADCPECGATIKRWPAPKVKPEPTPLSLDDDVPAPSSHRVFAEWHGQDRWAWALSLILVATGLLELAVGRTLIGLVFLLNTGLALADVDRLKKAGHKIPGVLTLWGIFLIPVYLWKRIALSKHGWVIFWTWWVAFALSIGMTWPVHEREEIEATARQLVTQIIRDNGWGSARCTRVEITGSSGDGAYRAIATLDDGRYGPITIQKTRSGMVYVEMRRP